MRKKFVVLSIIILFLMNFTGISVSANSEKEFFVDQLKSQKKVNIPHKDFKNTRINLSSFKKSSLMNQTNDDDYLIEMEPNNFPYQSNYLPSDTLMVGAFLTYDDIDFYEVTVPRSGTFLLAGATTDFSTIDLAIGLFDSYDNIIEPDYNDFTDNGMAFGYNLSPGIYYAAAIDYYGLPSLYGELYGIQVSMLDTVPPSKPTINPIDDNDKLLTGRSEPQSKVHVYRGSTLLKSGTADSRGTYSIPIPSQKAGTVLTVFSKDNAGNQSVGATTRVLDKTPPPIPTVNPVDDNDISVKGKTEANALVIIKKGTTTIGSAKANSNGEYSVSIKPVTANSTLSVTSKDSSGNTSKGKTITVLDKTPPKITKINIVDNNDQYVKGKAEANSTITVKKGTTVLGTAKTNSKGDFSVKIKSQSTNTVLSLYANDSAGNTSKASTVKVVKAK